jgi:hypothetical protein
MVHSKAGMGLRRRAAFLGVNLRSYLLDAKKNLISNFVQVRADGKLIPPTLAVREMLALGWEPSKVVALRWTHNGQQIKVELSGGIHGVVVPGENFVAALCGENELSLDGEVTIFAPDGSIHGKIGGPIAVSGHDVRGTFCD